MADVSTISLGDLQVFNGANRYLTANLISQASYDSADTAILVDATNFPDALAAGPLARAFEAPILLSSPTSLNPETRQELSRLGVSQVFIIGGTGAISLTVENTLLSLGYSVHRIQGASRYHTAVEVAKVLQAKLGTVSRAVITVGDHFADALSAGSYASRDGYPILLTERYSVPQATIDHLVRNRISFVDLIGGDLVIDEAVVRQLQSANILVDRISGSDRIQTSTRIANRFFGRSTHAIIANGWNFVDALAATPFAAKNNAPILLVDQSSVQPVVMDYLRYYRVNKVHAAGGELVISKTVRDQVQTSINDELFSIRDKNSDGSYGTKTVVGRTWETYAREAFDLQNQHRIKNGQRALTWSDGLADPAKLRTAELSILFSHTRPDGTSCYTAATTQTFNGENVAAGYFTPQEVFEAFRASSGHNANMLNSTYTKGAFGCIVIDGQFYWTALFAR